MSEEHVVTKNFSEWVTTRIKEVFVGKEVIEYTVIQSISNLAIYHLLSAYDIQDENDEFIISNYWVYKRIFGHPYYLTKDGIGAVKRPTNWYGIELATWIIVARTIFRVTNTLANKPLNRNRITQEFMPTLMSLKEIMPTQIWAR